MKAGDRIGDWLLEAELGRGGNAVVWRATRGKSEAAVKILTSTRPGSESYRRFRDEIGALNQLRDLEGILPLLEAHLPDRPSAKNPAFTVMPVADTARSALAGSSLEDVVSAVASLATTLSLLAEKGIAHRDVKPENVFRYRGSWVLGDFGLVEFPNKDAITVPGKRLGPAHFVAPEMIADPVNAQGPPADVYSLAKTLWVLASGQRWPPPGELRLDRPGLLLSSYVGGQRTQLLEPTIARATRHQPTERPTAAALASQLQAWLTPSTAIADLPDLSDVSDWIASYDAASMERSADRAQRIRAVNMATDRLKPALDQIYTKLARAMPGGGGYSSSNIVVESGFLGPVTHAAGYAAQRLADLERINLGALQFYAGISGGEREDGRAILGAAYILMDNRRRETMWHAERMFEPGTAEEDEAIHQLALGLANNLEAAVRRFAVVLGERIDAKE